MKYLCPSCRTDLHDRGGRLVCQSCDSEFASTDSGMVCFDGCVDNESFFEKQALERLTQFYQDYSPERFLEVLSRAHLWEMDWPNKRVGITQKFWWEPHIGKIEGKKILEIGCGVNYIVPYFLHCKNNVFAFDICKEAVFFLKDLLDRIEAPQEAIEFAVADAQVLELGEKFDIIDINNVLHHIEDKPAVFERAHRALKDDGKLIIVEPNYYYPPRWMIETDVLDPLNFVKGYFVRNDLIEKGEKAIIFRRLRQQLRDAGFKIDKTFKDRNYLGYFIVYWTKESTVLTKTIFALDKHLFGHILPATIAPFQYIIASKA